MIKYLFAFACILLTAFARGEDAAAQPHSAKEALLGYKWDFSARKAQKGVISFRPDGSVDRPWRVANAWHWEATEPRSFTLTTDTQPPRTITLSFDAAFTRFEGMGFDGITMTTGVRADLIAAPPPTSRALAPTPPAPPRPKPASVAQVNSTPAGPAPVTPRFVAGSSVRVVLSPDGKTIVAGGPHYLTLFDTGTAKSFAHLDPAVVGKSLGLPFWEQGFGDWEFSADSKTLLISDHRLIYDVATGAATRTDGFNPGSNREVSFALAAFSPDGLTAMRSDKYKNPVLTRLGAAFNVETHQSSGPLYGQPHVALTSDEVGILSKFHFSLDGKYLVGAVVPQSNTRANISKQPNFMIWDVASRERIAIFPLEPGPKSDFRLTPNGAVLIASQSFANPGYKLYDVVARAEIGPLEKDPNERIDLMLVSPDSRLVVGKIILGTANGSDPPQAGLRVWSATTGRRLADLPASEEVLYRQRELAFSADSRTLTGVCGEKGRPWNRPVPELIRRWDMPSGNAGASIPIPAAIKQGGILFLSADGATLAGSCADGAIRLWTIGPSPARVMGMVTAALPPERPASDFKTVPPGSKIVFRGTKVFFSDASGNLTPAPDGEYQTMPGYILRVRGGESYISN